MLNPFTQKHIYYVKTLTLLACLFFHKVSVDSSCSSYDHYETNGYAMTENWWLCFPLVNKWKRLISTWRVELWVRIDVNVTGDLLLFMFTCIILMYHVAPLLPPSKMTSLRLHSPVTLLVIHMNWMRQHRMKMTKEMVLMGVLLWVCSNCGSCCYYCIVLHCIVWIWKNEVTYVSKRFAVQF